MHSLTAPSDYTEVTRTLNFAPATTRIEVTIPIVDDDIVESVENFFAMLALETVGANVIVDPARTQINIVDNDSKLCVRVLLSFSRGNIFLIR